MNLLHFALFTQSVTLTVITLNANHQPVSAKVYLQSKEKTLNAQSDSKGVALFSVPAGTYTVRAEDNAESVSVPITLDGSKKVEVTLEPQFFDEPSFTVAGVTDNTYRGGHGADTILRSSEDLSKATAELTAGHPDIDPLDTVRKYQQSAEADPSEVNLFNWGTELLVHRAPQAAIQVFGKAVQHYPESTRLILGLAASYYAAGSYDQAAHCFFEAADVNPSDPTPYLFLSKVKARQIMESPGYHERLDRFRKLHPENALANYYDAQSLWQHNQAKEAQEFTEKAISLDPHLGVAYLQLGIIHASMQDYTNAIKAYEKAIAENPELEEAHYRLSEAYRITGDAEKSRSELAIYKELSKTSAEKLEGERRDIQQFVISLKK